MCQLFAPTSIRLTFETEGKGKLSQDMIEQVAEKDESGNVVSLKLPDKFVLTANHQVYNVLLTLALDVKRQQIYADWWYMWCLMYFIGAQGMHRYVYITLKKSLQWVPIFGWVRRIRIYLTLAHEQRRECNYLISFSWRVPGRPTRMFWHRASTLLGRLRNRKITHCALSYTPKAPWSARTPDQSVRNSPTRRES